jgi:hypothetical protein
MPDDQHDHAPGVPAQPDAQQAPDAQQENDEKEPQRQQRNTIHTPEVYATTEALRQVLDSPSQRLLRDSLATQLSPVLTTFASTVNDRLGESLATQLSPVLTTFASTVNDRLGESLATQLSPVLTTFASTVNDRLGESLATQLSPVLTTFASTLNELDLRHLMPGGALSRNEAFRLAISTLWERLQAVDPENWRGERIRRLDMLAVMEEGIPLVWTPSADVIRELLDAPDAATRRKVLEQQGPVVVEDCRTVLTDVARTDLASEVDFLHDCLESIGNGKYAAAQVLASSVLDTILRAMVRADPLLQNNKGGFTFNILAAQLPKATPDTLVGQFRAYCIHTSIHKAYDQYFGPPVPEEYNRHATAHAAGPTQITLANALAAVMLAVGLVRELEETQRPLSPAG